MSFISDHDLFFCSFDFKLNNNIGVGTEFYYRDYKAIKLDELFSDLNRFHWNFGGQLLTPD